MDKVKMFLFARWMATEYADEHCDDKMVSQHEPEFNPEESMCVLNREKGEWWKKELKHFMDVVYPNYEKNGDVEETYEYIHGYKLYCNCENPWNVSGDCVICGRPIKLKGFEGKIPPYKWY